MDGLLKELEALSRRPEVPNARLVGAMIATAVRCRDILNTRMVGIQAFATATAMQPRIDPLRLYDDYMKILGATYDSPREIPSDLLDIALAIKLAATDRHEAD